MKYEEIARNVYSFRRNDGCLGIADPKRNHIIRLGEMNIPWLRWQKHRAFLRNALFYPHSFLPAGVPNGTIMEALLARMENT
jgi:hypothetical protein